LTIDDFKIYSYVEKMLVSVITNNYKIKNFVLNEFYIAIVDYQGILNVRSLFLNPVMTNIKTLGVQFIKLFNHKLFLIDIENNVFIYDISLNILLSKSKILLKINETIEKVEFNGSFYVLIKEAFGYDNVQSIWYAYDYQIDGLVKKDFNDVIITNLRNEILNNQTWNKTYEYLFSISNKNVVDQLIQLSINEKTYDEFLHDLDNSNVMLSTKIDRVVFSIKLYLSNKTFGFLFLDYIITNCLYNELYIKDKDFLKDLDNAVYLMNNSYIINIYNIAKSEFLQVASK